MLRNVWISLERMAGVIARKITSKTACNILRDITLGITGAVIGSFLFNHFGPVSVAGLSENNILVEVIGAVALLVLFQAASSLAP